MPRLIKKYQNGNPMSWNPTSMSLQDPTKMYTNYFDKSLKTDLKLPSGNFKGDPMIMGKMQLKAPTLDSKLPAATGSMSIGKPSFLSQNLGGIGAISSMVGPLVADRSATPFTKGLNTAYDTIASTVSKFGPYGKAIGGVMKVGGAVGGAVNNLLGGGATGTKVDQFLSSSFANLTPIGFLNTALGKKSKAYSKDLAADVNVGYTADIGIEQKKYGWLSGKARRADSKRNERTNVSNINKLAIIRSGKEENLASANVWQDGASRNEQSMLGGINTLPLSAKKGAKINPAQLRNIVNKVKYTRSTPQEVIEEETPKFEEGGKLNVIPEGALHARKNDLPEEIAEQVTNKGIPVITYDEGGEITQHAEIEVNEIIFNKETTERLEEYCKKFEEAKSDEAKEILAIEAGKFLTTEILENTDDRTGLLNEVE